jgi:nanoRNase/pAp phosphatase (c-di-AMP/oligoRNAs hydrolase)
MDEVPVKPRNGRSSGSSKKHPYQEFIDFFNENKHEHPVAIFSHASPDPDAIASMMGVAWLLDKVFDLECQLYYAGEVSHPQNNSMVNLLSPGMKRIEELSDHGATVLVDTVPAYAGVIREGHIEWTFDVVIDHHREAAEDAPVIIHKKVGSCAAIIYDMMKECVPPKQWLDAEVDADTKVATALLAGIMTDTHFMMSDDCTELDRHAFNDLFEYRNAQFLHEIVFFKRRKFWIAKKAEACAQASVDDEGFAIVGLGLIPDRERDLIADMAEEMVSWASVETAIAFGVVGGDRIEGSVRSLNSSLVVADFCKKLGGKHGTGGGKLGKGAYQLPLGGFSIDDEEDEEDAQEAWESIRKRESKRITRMINK